MQSTVCKMYTFITEMLESISKNTISFEMVIMAAIYDTI